MSNGSKGSGRILLTGGSGYVGGRLLLALEERGAQVRCLSRNPAFLRGRAGPGTEVVQGDVLDPTALAAAMRGIHTAYYLVHSMGSGGDFEIEDRRAANAFGEAAKAAGVRRIIYLGGLGSGPDLSAHLRSRHEVGEILRRSGVLTIELRASIIIGSGSLSFEMIRALTEKLPVMVTPRWVRVPAQPIAIEDVIDYLLAARDFGGAGSAVYEIGGADRVSYSQIMKEYARQRGLRRTMIPVPVLSPHLSGLWLGLVTPIYARVGRKLVDSLRNPTIVEDERALSDFAVRPRGIADAIERALHNEDRAFAETRWSDALSSAGSLRQWGGRRFGSRLVDSRSREVPVSTAKAFAPIRRLGGRTGWYWGDWLWRLRGFMDLLVGGVGSRRGRRDPDQVETGDTVDFWRVERVEPDRLLLLAAEMKLPGRAWLQFEVEQTARGSLIRQTAMFDPVGLFGLLYWYALYPLHTLVFAKMLSGIARAAVTDASAPQLRETASPGAG
jgi:uncharacterized protein YbjT (DUF2867 family)